MSSSGFLVPPSEDPSQEKLWVETWKRLDRFLPDLKKELDLDPKEKPTEAEQEKTATPVTPVAPVS
jgi:golgi-specific brefeldin A-resistance guanine nucleotide exchange factor 1